MTATRDEQGGIGQDDPRFRREDSGSSRPDAPLAVSRRRPVRRWLRRIPLVISGVLLFFVMFVVVGIYLIGVDAVGNERLRQEAESALSRIAGEEIDVQIGRLKLRPGTTSLFALEVQDAEITRAADQAFIARAGDLSFGIRFFPLLRGRIELSQISMADAELSATTIQPLLSGAGGSAVITATEAETVVFDAVRMVFSSARQAGLSRLKFENVALLAEQNEPLLRLEELDFRLSGGNSLVVEGRLQVAGQEIAIDAEAEQETDLGSISALSLSIKTDGSQWTPASSTVGLQRFGTVEAMLHGTETDQKGAWLELDAKLSDLLIAMRNSDLDVSWARLRIGMNREEDGFSISDASLSVGKSIINFEGVVSPDTEERKGYRFDLVSSNSLLAPLDSTEQPLPFSSRTSGAIDMVDGKLSVDSIDLRTANGSVSAKGSVTFSAGQAPGITFEMDVPEIPTAEAKQLWPWFAAPGTRKWVMDNVFGGAVKDSRLRYSVAPGRLGNGMPLSKDELSGQFSISGTRFDLVGELPAVRESDGWVDFEGTDVQVGLTKGVAYLPSGKVVRTGGGVMDIASAHQRPRIGKLAIDISGEAQAVAEFASLRPLNAKFLDLKPSDLSGQVSGHVRADIPLHEGIPSENLSWTVELTYDQLAIAKPIDGQMISNANGTMQIDRTQAQISATAEINGMPAKVELVEPIGGSKFARQRNIQLEVSDAEREKLFPGLGTLISGPMVVSFDQNGNTERKIDIDLVKSKLSVPWIGWQKGAGIPASASFIMREKDGQTELSDFKLSGESFGLTGRVIVGKGQLLEAQFNQVRFNRGDELSVSVKARGAGYDVSVNGNSFDARPVIKLVTGKEAKSEDVGKSSPITLKANLKQLIGFHDVTLENAVVDFSSGKGPDALTIRAATPRYGSVAFDRRTVNGQRQMRLQSENAGDVLRFLGFYRYMEGGNISLSLAGPNDNSLRGRFQVNDFWVVNEPRLSSLVAASSKSGKPSKQVDVTRVQFGTAFADIAKGQQQLDLANGIIRGPSIGFAFQGTLFDARNYINMTGTFMPAYGLNRIFGEIPLIGQILGNGRDRGLIGITFRVVGPFDNPHLEINPISAIAPGIFRQIFEYN